MSEGNGVTGKPVAVAEGREGGPTTLDLTKWDFEKADHRTRCRKLRRQGANSGGSAPGIHVWIIRNTSA